MSPELGGVSLIKEYSMKSANSVSVVVVVIASILLVGGVGHAQDEAPAPRYTFVEAGWLYVDPDKASSDNGWFAGVSVGLAKNFQVFGEYGDPGDFESWNVGGGWHGLLGRRADLVAQAAYVDADFDDGFRLQFGVRWMVIRPLEINGFLNYTDLDLTDSTAVAVNGIFLFGKTVGVGAGYEAGDDGDTARAFVRFNIGKK
jgi:hypothetical protein